MGDDNSDLIVVRCEGQGRGGGRNPFSIKNSGKDSRVEGGGGGDVETMNRRRN